MKKTFFTSDLHFSHRNIAKFCPHTRPQPTQTGDIDTLDRYMIELWNDTVGVDDDVYNLGDLSFSHNLRHIKKVLSQLNGRHHLIFGNHDDIIMQNVDKFLTTTKHDGHPILASAQSYLKLKLEDKTLILFHYPIAEWDGCHKGYYHLHGHIHDRMAEIGGRILNAGFDLHGRFLTLDDVVGYLQDLPTLDHFSDDSPVADLAVPSVLATSPSFAVAKADEQIQQNVVDIQALIKQRLDYLMSQGNVSQD
ncbi:MULTISPECIES: phosphoesterase [unclassified Moraxella]|uniref:phosphoesterase n=1 Tax=unclassified Moraxella TaxID=2685852 RepID=UPI003AF795C7